MYPELNLIKDRLLESGAEKVLMTGSGPTIFGVFSDCSRRDLACAHLEKKVSDEWIIIPTFTLTKAEVF
jgi:4-diphosphocytidyl-2-C-methyl-D-erythritol kinase